MELCVHVSGLRKSYGQVHAVDGISFDIEYGKVFGFLGPNGAGKTTTIRVLTTLVNPTSGIVKIFGKDIVKHSREIKKRMGVVLQEPSFEANVTVDRALELYGLMWRMPGEKRRDRARELMEKFDLVSFSNMKNDELSIGQRRRVQVAREFMHDMDLMFLDEPTVGLDPAARRTLLDYVKKYVQSGLTVFFTTHIMEEAEYLCDEIAIINKGKITATDTPDGLKQRYGGVKTVEIKLKDSTTQSVMHIIRQIADGSVIETPAQDTIRIGSAEAQEMLVKIIEYLSKNGVQIESISINPPTLEEVFLTVIGGGGSGNEGRA
ncbi:MAG: ABC transporter ATP-binding protein [Nitrososphaeraceae archaeon]|jgi:ABC-2 type transport system ATP-binding protein|nr:efflux transporter, ATP-binding protein [Nitrososphaera sp.]MCY1155162.1 efflux transporter, ATP-binding protein [Nitrososphaera sp.]MCY1156024.1 efflux transporter, ATP-binding protein [Nitrososphaera sp.]MDW0121171.1 ABC transporter ATP-binding protein [Nitrososphaeraceae archaeon]